MVVVDIQTTIIPAKTRVWRLQPGESYVFLPAFDEQKLAFLDLPGLELPSGSLQAANDLVARVVASLTIINAKRELGADADVSSIRLSDFEHARTSRRRGRLRQSVINFFHEAKAGDYVIAPSSLSDGVLRVGRFSRRKTHAFGKFEKKYGDTPIPARRIEWLSKTPENQASAHLMSGLRNENPFTLVERNNFEEVFALAHDTFQFGERHSATIRNESDDYTDRESTLLALLSQLSASYCELIDTKSDAKRDLFDRILAPGHIEYSCAHTSDVHSRGFNRFQSGKATPFIIATVLGILVYFADVSSPESIKDDLKSVSITNTIGPSDDPCVWQTSEASKRLLDGLNGDQLWALCQKAKEAEERAGLRSGVKIRQDNP